MIICNLSTLLGKRKMSQSELARITGIRNATISALYHDKWKRIETDQMNVLCEALRCTPGELFSYEPDIK